MADPMLTSLCAICHVSTPKYKCPRCSLRTCSLACIKKHKAWSECSGERDATAYVPPSKLRTPAGVDHDYNFLHGIEMSVERSEKVLVGEKALVQTEELRPMTTQEVRWKTGRDGRKRKVLLTRVLTQARGRTFEKFLAQRLKRMNVGVLCAPLGMSRQRENHTTLNRRTGRINWQVEWLQIGSLGTESEPNTELATRLLSKVMDDVPMYKAYQDALDERIKAEKREEKRQGKEDGPLGSLPASRCLPALGCLQDPATGSWFTYKGDGVDLWPSEKQRLFQFFLARPHTQAGQPVMVTKVAEDDCFRDMLANTRVLEFPTIYVLKAGESLPADFVTGPKDTVPTETPKRKRGPDSKAGGQRNAKKRRNGGGDDGDIEEGEVGADEDGDDAGESKDTLAALEAGEVIAEQSFGEEDDEDDETSSSGTSSESESD